MLTRLASRTPFGADDEAAQVLARTHWVLAVSVGIWVAGRFVAGLPVLARDGLLTLALLGLLLQLGVWGTKLIDLRVRDARRERLKDDAATATAMGAVGILAKAALYIVLLLLALDNLGFEVTALIAGLGVAGVAVALAVQSILGDLLASLSIVLDRPFVIGDSLEVGDYQGKVEHVGLKSTRLRSLSGEQLIFANADLLSSRIRNYRRMSERRVVSTLSLACNTPYATLRAVPDILREVVDAQSDVRFGRAHFCRYGDWSLDFELVYFVTDRDYDLYMDVQHAINLEIYRRFEEEAITLAYPTTTVLFDRDKGVPGGDTQ